MKFFTTILIVYSLLIGNVFGAVISDDTLKIGKPGSSANKEITLGTTKKIRANESSGRLEFSNDGSLYKNLGSGSGTGGSSGIMLNENDSFEDGLTPGWTSSGGTFTQETYANSSTDDTKYAQFVATIAGQYFETTAKAIPTNFSAGCQADIKKVNTTAANLFKIDVIDGSANILATANIGLLTWQKIPTLSFPCPSSGSTVKLRVTSLAAGTILADRGYVGSNQNLIYTSQAKLIGTVNVNNCAAGWTTTSTSLASFAAQSGCTYTVTGELLAPLTNIPAFRIAKLLPGDYRIEYEGAYSQTTAAKSGWVRFTDGTNLAKELSAIYSGGGQITVPSLTQTISYGVAQSNVTMELKGYTDSGGTTTIFGVNTTPATFRLWYFPSSSEVAVSNEQSSWFIDANIGGQNPNLGTGSVSSYSEIPATTVDLVINSSKGSAAAEIPCASGTASTGLTCTAANESLGIAFTPPGAGVYEACFAFTHSSGSSGNLTSTFQLVETPNTALTILQEGGQRIQSGASVTNSQGPRIPNYVCGTFNFSDTSKKTIRLFYEQITSAVTSSEISADRDATLGQRDIKVTVRPLLSAYNRPILTGDQVITTGQVKPVRFSGIIAGASSGTVCSSNPCTVYNAKGNQIGVATWISAGLMSLAVSGLSGTPNCQVSPAHDVITLTSFPSYRHDLSSSSVLIFRNHTASTGAATNGAVNFSCDGNSNI